jgi:hypothetical protein
MKKMYYAQLWSAVFLVAAVIFLLVLGGCAGRRAPPEGERHGVLTEAQIAELVRKDDFMYLFRNAKDFGVYRPPGYDINHEAQAYILMCCRTKTEVKDLLGKHGFEISRLELMASHPDSSKIYDEGLTATKDSSIPALMPMTSHEIFVIYVYFDNEHVQRVVARRSS